MAQKTWYFDTTGDLKYDTQILAYMDRGDTGEMLLTTETDGRGARVEIVPHTIADAVRELK